MENDVPSALKDALRPRVLIHWLGTPMVEWSQLYESLDSTHQQTIIGDLQSLGERALRLSVYLEQRASDHGHDRAVNEQNRIGRAVRKAVGFTYPERGDVNF
jgi:hypothetical protein